MFCSTMLCFSSPIEKVACASTVMLMSPVVVVLTVTGEWSVRSVRNMRNMRNKVLRSGSLPVYIARTPRVACTWDIIVEKSTYQG